MDLTRRLVLGSLAATFLPLRAYGQVSAKEPAKGESASAAGSDGFKALEAQKTALQLRPAPASETAVSGYDGAVPGPLLRFKKGEEVKIRLSNKLDQPTSIHWSGLRLPNAMDGVAPLTQAAVAPGASFDYRFTPPDSGFFWYRSGDMAQEQGLYGALIVDEAEPMKVDADMLIVLDDWRLDDKGALAATSRASDAPPFVTINSSPAAVEETLRPGSRLRLRLVSTASEQIIVVSFIGIKPLVIGIDGQPCEAFEPVQHSLPLHPGARFDVVFDLPMEEASESTLLLRGNGVPDRPLCSWKTKGEKRPDAGPLPALPRNPLLPNEIHLEKSTKVDLVIEGGPVPPAPTLNEAAKKASPGKPAKPAPQPLAPTPASDQAKLWKINGVAVEGYGPKPLFTVKRGTPVTLGFINKTGVFQTFHVHGHVFRLLHDLDDGWEPYWRESLLIPEGRTKHIAFVADNPGKWAIESTMAGRAAHGLASWFEVT